jgi:hypothetical protein
MLSQPMTDVPAPERRDWSPPALVCLSVGATALDFAAPDDDGVGGFADSG